MTDLFAKDGPPASRSPSDDDGREARVLVPCPRTGTRLDTGLRMSAARFRRFAPRNARVFCPICAATHRWTQAEALLDDGDRP